MKLQLISYALCPYVHRSTIALHEKGVPFELTYIDLAHKPDWFLALSPRGRVPLLVADGKPIFESAVINEFLDETHAPRFLPDEPFERARQRGWIEVASDLFVAHGKLAFSREGDAGAVEKILAGFEAELRGPFFAGEAIGLVDFAVAPVFCRLALDVKLGAAPLVARFPRVATWAERLLARPSVARGVPADFEARYRAMLRERGDGAYVRV